MDRQGCGRVGLDEFVQRHLDRRAGVLAEAADGLAGFFEPVHRVAVGVAEQWPERVDVGVVVVEDGVDGVELHDQRTQVVGEDVVDFPGGVGPLGQLHGPGSFLLGSLAIGQAKLCLFGPQFVLAHRGSEQEPGDRN